MQPEPYSLIGFLAFQTGLLSWTLRPSSRAQPSAAASAACAHACSCEEEVRDLLDLTRDLHWWQAAASCALAGLLLTWLAVAISCCGTCCSVWCCRKVANAVRYTTPAAPAVTNRTPALELTDEAPTAVYTPKKRKP